MYVDDDTEVVHDKDPENLKEKIQMEADLSVNWLKDNRMCVAGDKSKLLISGTRQLKDKKVLQPIEIRVDGKMVQETRSEKLLGIVINSEMTGKITYTENLGEKEIWIHQVWCLSYPRELEFWKS